MTNLIQTLISGLSLGSIYSLIALGYTMVYGIAKMLNFAHGDVIMVGAYSGIVAVAQMGLSPWACSPWRAVRVPCLSPWPTAAMKTP